MNKPNHTPGPWKVELDSQFEHDVVDKHGNVIATAIGEPQIELSAQQANARLIAAAPELLEACKLAKRQLWRHRFRFSPADHRTMDKLTEAINQIQEATK